MIRGSNPLPGSIKYATVAQLAVHLICNQKAIGSNPICGSEMKEIKNPEIIKVILERKKAKEELHVHLRSGGKLSNLSEELKSKFKFVDPLKDSK